jgi:hypothetical protein
MRIEVFQYEFDDDHPKRNWKAKKHIYSIVTDNWQKVIPKKDRILIIFDKKKERRYYIDKERYVYNNDTDELYLYLIVSKRQVEEP